MSKLRMTTLAALLAASATTAMATDYTALRDDERVHNELLAGSVAFLLDEGCPALDFRKMKVLGRGLSLQRYVSSELGYSFREIKAYVDSPTEQDRFRALARPIVRSMGAIPGNEESYCAVGRAEIEKGTLAGSILRER
ncbi:DUF5333 domain-containing protein [Aliiroseovarius subalbicans]|uniref:DUF5333 domain-containing protein n=1 Tax=Aliiroseovarius subalbicans TaxID=2925840 RepID=UPI001F56E256|nr:DUF5333 domain-containing protein [Aliiroseovarius subalbicans]MCI2398026.1 DUF5333 domain-containing protein [Aliiroseovarius subalbicans]